MTSQSTTPTSSNVAQKPPLLPAYLIVGEDELKRRRTIERLRMRAREEGDIDFNHDEFDAESSTTTGSAIASACNTLPFASNIRLVEVKHVDKLKKDDADILTAYLTSPSPSTVLALMAEKLAKNTRLYKAVDAIGKNAVIDCAPPKRYDLAKMLRSMAVGYGFAMTDAAANKLIDLVGEDTVRLDQELNKISLALVGQDTVTDRDVESLVARTTEAKPWELVNAFCDRDLKLCLEQLSTMNESPIRLLALCVTRLRELACAKSLEKRGAGNELATIFKAPAWRFKNHPRWARNFTEQELKEAFVSARDCERVLKSTSLGTQAFEDWLVSVIVRN